MYKTYWQFITTIYLIYLPIVSLGLEFRLHRNLQTMHSISEMQIAEYAYFVLNNNQ